MSARPDAWPKENAVESFSTYGPAYRFLGSAVGDETGADYYELKLLVILFHVLIFSLFWIKTGRPWVIWFLAFFFAVFNFPSYATTPLILLIWALASPKRNSTFLLHLFVGLMYASLIFLYKPSWGIAGMMQVCATILFLPRKQNVLHRLMHLAGSLAAFLVLSLIFYLLFTQKGTFQTFLMYGRIALLDSSDYSEFQFFYQYRENVYYLLYPIVVFLVLTVCACFKTENKRYWLFFFLFPLLFVEFKHSYVRADITNLKNFFWMAPLIFLFTALRYRSVPLRLTALLFIASSTLASFAGWSPYNTPYRHARRFWIQFPAEYEKEWKDKRQLSRQQVKSYFQSFEWVKSQIEGGSLLSVPRSFQLTRLGEERHILPSNQIGFRNLSRKILESDFRYLREKSPDYVLLEDLSYNMEPVTALAPDFFAYVFRHYEQVQSRELFTLLRRRSTPLSFNRTTTTRVPLNQGVGGLRFQAPPGTPLFIEGEGLTSLTYRLRCALLKGDRLYLNWTDGVANKSWPVSYATIEHGFFLVPDIDGFNKGGASREQRIFFSGRQMDDFPYDLGHYLPGKTEKATLRVTLLEVK